MHHYTVVPAHSSTPAFEFGAEDAFATLSAMERRSIQMAHAYEDHLYAFTARQSSEGGGSWVIQTLPELVGHILPVDHQPPALESHQAA